MTIDRRQLLASAIALSAVTVAPGLASAAPVSDPRLKALLDSFVQQMLVENPENATTVGLDGGAASPLKHRLSDVSAEGRKRTLEAYADRARRLRAIPRASLSGRDLTTYDTTLYAMEMEAEGAAFPYGRTGAVPGAVPYVVSQQDGAVANTGEFLNSQHAIASAADAEAYLDRLEAMAGVLAEETRRARDDAAQGVSPPDFILATVADQVRELRGQPAAETRLVRSLAERARAKGIDGDWAERATKIVEQRVFPALDAQLAAVKALHGRATHDAGVWKLPDGEAYYRWALKEGTTTSLSAAEIHKMGLEQGREIDAQLDTLLRGQGLSQGTIGARLSALTADPQFLFPDSAEGRQALIDYVNGRLAAVRPLLPRLSRLKLKAPVEVKATPKEIEAGAALGYMNFPPLDGSRPAIYYINLHDMRNWPRYTLATLTMHEALPGHAWQSSYLAEQRQDIHPIFSVMAFNAFVEGWALYAEQLADEASLYADDSMGRLGYLQAQRFRAARLTVDTGLHAKRWTREQAIDWMVGATGRSRRSITSEVDRYCVAPGQACGYKVGHSELLRLRRKAQTALGSRFDLRDYNDAVVTTGGAPLSVLETVIDRYVAGARSA